MSESTLTSRIKTVRRVACDDGTDQHVIRTVHGHGYQHWDVVQIVPEHSANDNGMF